MASLLRWLLAGLLCLAAVAPAAAADETPDAALAALLQQARAGCAQPAGDRLGRILCGGRIRVGVREYYPLFGTREGKLHSGYEVDIARAIAHRLGVAVEFAKVNAASRVPMLADDRIDLAIATMGDNVQRESQVRFIRPHYYRSETSLIGPRELPIGGWKDIAGLTVCVTVGNGSNAELVSRGARLMLFDEAVVLPDRLEDRTCTLAAQDDSFFAYYFTDPNFARRFDRKLGFAEVPWGMGVAREGSAQLARALDLLSQIFHRDGIFLDLARANRIGTGFLEAQKAVWARSECNTARGDADPACILPPANPELPRTRFADAVGAFEAWFSAATGVELVLPMLKTVPAWSLFLNGVVNSLVLVLGALAATLAFALAFGAALGSPHRLVRWPARAVTVALQSSPIVLTLVISATVMHGIFRYSAAVALAAAILALGLANGANAGQAIAEALVSLRHEGAGHGIGLFSRAVARAATQIMAFLINAAKGTPIASFIGAPELLSALTDITAFASGRATTYTLLLVFYTAVVMLVVWLCGRVRANLERRHAPA